MADIVIDGKNLVLGRLGTFVAKRAILGDTVHIVNCQDVMISGKKDMIIERYKKRFSRGTIAKGPFMNRQPDRFVKRSIRGMFTYKKGRGKEAFKNIRCYIGKPERLTGKETQVPADVSIENRNQGTRYMSVREICLALGWKQRVDIA